MTNQICKTKLNNDPFDSNSDKLITTYIKDYQWPKQSNKVSNISNIHIKHKIIYLLIHSG